MPSTPEERVRKRARQALSEGKDFRARGEVNKVILDEVRAELQQEVATGCKAVKTEARVGKKRLRAVEQAACQSIRDVAEHEIRRVKEAAMAASGSEPTTPALPQDIADPTERVEPEESIVEEGRAHSKAACPEPSTSDAGRAVPSQDPVNSSAGHAPERAKTAAPSAVPSQDPVANKSACPEPAPTPDATAKFARLKELTYQLAVVKDLTLGDPLARLYVKTKLSDEQRTLLTKWPEGERYLMQLTRAMEHPEGIDCDTGAKLALKDCREAAIIQLRKNAETLQHEYEEACSSARESVIHLQKLALDVLCQQDLAHRERIGRKFHEGHKAAVLAFRKLSSELERQAFISQHWLLECQQHAGLDDSEYSLDPSNLALRPLACAVGNEYSLIWQPQPAGPRGPFIRMCAARA